MYIIYVVDKDGIVSCVKIEAYHIKINFKDRFIVYAADSNSEYNTILFDNIVEIDLIK